MAKRNVRRRDVLSALGAAGITGLAGCATGNGNGDGDANGGENGGGNGGGNGNGNGDGGTPMSTAPFKVGFLTILTGNLSLWGPDTTAAVELLASNWTEGGGVQGREVEITIVDTQAQAEMAIQKARQLVNEENVDALGCYLTTPEVTAIQNLAAREEIPFVSCSTGGKSLVENCNPFAFRGGTSTTTKARSGGPFAVEELGQDVFLVNYDYSYGYQIEEDWTTAIEGAGGTIVGTARSAPGTSDWSSVISKIEQADPDWVLDGISGGDAISFLTQSNQQGVTYPHMAHVYFENILTGLDPAVTENIPIYANREYTYSLDRELNNQFVEAFEQKTDRKPGLAGGTTYRHLDVFLQSANDASDTEGPTLASNYEDYTGETLTGEYTMRGCDHQGKFPMHNAQMTGFDDTDYPVWEILGEVSGDEAVPPCSETDCNL